MQALCIRKISYKSKLKHTSNFLNCSKYISLPN